MHRCLEAVWEAQARARASPTSSTEATTRAHERTRALIARLVRHALLHSVSLEHLHLPLHGVGGLERAATGASRTQPHLLDPSSSASAAHLDFGELMLRLACRHDLPLDSLLSLTLTQ